MTNALKKQIESWVKDYEKTNQAIFGGGLVEINEETFEGSAYQLFIAILGEK